MLLLYLLVSVHFFTLSTVVLADNDVEVALLSSVSSSSLLMQDVEVPVSSTKFAEVEARLIASLQALEDRNSELEAQVKALQARTADLETRLGTLEAPPLAAKGDDKAAAGASATEDTTAQAVVDRPAGRKLLQTTLESRVQAIERKLTSVSTDSGNNFCIGLHCFVPSGDFMAIRHKISWNNIITWDNNPNTGDFIRMYPPGGSGLTFFFINRVMEFGVWNSGMAAPAGILRAGAFCPSNAGCASTDIVKKLAKITTDSDGNICVGNSCLAPSGDYMAIRHKTSKQTLISWDHNINAGDFVRMYPPGGNYNKYFFINKSLMYGVKK